MRAPSDGKSLLNPGVAGTRSTGLGRHDYAVPTEKVTMFLKVCRSDPENRLIS